MFQADVASLTHRRPELEPRLFYVRTEKWDRVVSKNFGITLSISPRQCNPVSSPTQKLEYKTAAENERPPLWSSGQSCWLQIQRSRVRFPALPDFLSSSGSGTESTQPREVN